MKRMLPEVLNIVRRYETNNPNELAERIGIDVNYVNLSRFQKNVRYESRLYESRSF